MRDSPVVRQQLQHRPQQGQCRQQPPIAAHFDRSHSAKIPAAEGQQQIIRGADGRQTTEAAVVPVSGQLCNPHHATQRGANPGVKAHERSHFTRPAGLGNAERGREHQFFSTPNRFMRHATDGTPVGPVSGTGGPKPSSQPNVFPHAAVPLAHKTPMTKAPKRGEAKDTKACRFARCWLHVESVGCQRRPRVGNHFCCGWPERSRAETHPHSTTPDGVRAGTGSASRVDKRRERISATSTMTSINIIKARSCRSGSRYFLSVRAARGVSPQEPSPSEIHERHPDHDKRNAAPRAV